MASNPMPEEGYLADLAAIETHDTRGRLGAVTCPVLTVGRPAGRPRLPGAVAPPARGVPELDLGRGPGERLPLWEYPDLFNATDVPRSGPALVADTAAAREPAVRDAAAARLDELLADLAAWVDKDDTSSEDAAALDAGTRSRRRRLSAGSPSSCRARPACTSTRRPARQRTHPRRAGRPPRHRLPERHRGGAAVLRRGRPRARARRRGHEGRPARRRVGGQPRRVPPGPVGTLELVV